jgi:hypothetical protein
MMNWMDDDFDGAPGEDVETFARRESQRAYPENPDDNLEEAHARREWEQVMFTQMDQERTQQAGRESSESEEKGESQIEDEKNNLLMDMFNDMESEEHESRIEDAKNDLLADMMNDMDDSIGPDQENVETFQRKATDVDYGYDGSGGEGMNNNHTEWDQNIFGNVVEERGDQGRGWPYYEQHSYESIHDTEGSASVHLGEEGNLGSGKKSSGGSSRGEFSVSQGRLDPFEQGMRDPFEQANLDLEKINKDRSEVSVEQVDPIEQANLDLQDAN